MRQTILLSLFAFLVLGTAHQATAQHHGGSGNSVSRGGHEFHGNRSGREFNRNRGASPYGYGYGIVPPYDSGYAPDDYDNFAYQPQPPLDYDQQPSQPVQPAQPVASQTAHPVIKEYTWPAPGKAAPSPSPTTDDSEPLAFAIVLKNGSTLSATMVLASDRGLQYVDSDGKLRRISISEVDRAATLKLDRARNLNLHLPAAD
ncbi:MAG: hypothetical protein WBP85_11280 [Terracidiphilus sp.]